MRVGRMVMRLLGALALAGGLVGVGIWFYNSRSRAPIRWRLAYDDSGAVASVVDPAGRSAQVRYERDDSRGIRRVVKELPGGLRVSAEVDPHGRITKATDDVGTIAFDYDGYNRLVRVRRDDWPPLSYIYNTLDQLTSISAGETLTTRYSYDYLGRLETVESPAGKVTYRYAATQDGKRVVIRTLPNKVWTQWSYVPGGRISTITHAKGDKGVIEQYSYTYRPDGLLIKVVEWAQTGKRTLEFEYDKVQRLLAVRDTKGDKTSYQYDKFGNRTDDVAARRPVSTARYDWAGRMVEHDGQPCTHDAARSLTGYAGNDTKASFAYTARNALARVARDGETVSYQQDGSGALISRTAAGNTSKFVLDARADAWRPVLAIDDAGRQTLYVWEGNTPLAAISEGRVEYYLTDQLGSVRCIVDQAGEVANHFDYDAFGVPAGGFAEGDLRPGFAGLFYDPRARLYLAIDRAYDPLLGRFLQRDPRRRVPTGSQLGLSAYSYCGDDPLNLVDRSGSDPRPAGVVRLLNDMIGADSFEVTAAIARLVGMDYGKGASLSLVQSGSPGKASPAPLDVIGEKPGSLPSLRDYVESEYVAFVDPNATRVKRAEAFQRLGEEAALNGIDARVRSVTAPPAKSRGGNKPSALMNWELIREQSERQSRRAKLLDLLLKVQEKSDRLKEQTGQVGARAGG